MTVSFVDKIFFKSASLKSKLFYRLTLSFFFHNFVPLLKWKIKCSVTNILLKSYEFEMGEISERISQSLLLLVFWRTVFLSIPYRFYTHLSQTISATCIGKWNSQNLMDGISFRLHVGFLFLTTSIPIVAFAFVRQSV